MIRARLTSREEPFREIMRRLGYSWRGDFWTRELTVFTGNADDRCVELAHTLLTAGYIVELPDEAAMLLDRIVAGAYAPECRRWIKKNLQRGWFIIRWPRDEDFYVQARRIRGSRYDAPSVIVPPEAYEEVLDFAEMHGFQLSACAQELVETARERYESAIMVAPARRKQAPRLPPAPMPDTIDPELLDDLDDDDIAVCAPASGGE